MVSSGGRMCSMYRTLKILICDDSLIIRRKLCESIKICYTDVIIIEATDGMSAERMFVIHQPDLIFMDIILPDRNGIDTVKRLKEIDPDAKIIMISTAGTRANLFKSVSAGAFDFIQKPIEQATVEKVINAFVERMDHYEAEGELL
jgi:two-component system, chemotaxis family, chemotaxis protein CheY